MASRCFFPRDMAVDGCRHQQSKPTTAVLEQLHHGGRLLSREDVGGTVRVKIVISKRELKQMVAALDDGAGDAAAAAVTTDRHRRQCATTRGGSSCTAGAVGPGIEQRLPSLRRHSMRRATEAARRMQASGEWEPGLQSIPEEVF
ncbi:uncharacterized protein [Miscanthus floridulus]|uniref:uncharacterized protein n=1 Tax=Miscanthus floridulus TaxID=154761 RepID=UPI0034582ACB